MSFQLSPDQINAIDGICATLLDPTSTTHAMAVLTGSAGTGKSTVISELIDRVKHNGSTNIELCATTNRAATVLQDIVGHPVKTGYAAFKLRPSVSTFGTEVIKPAGTCEITDGSIVVMDESSMIGNKFLQAIVETVKKKCLKLLFVGDPFQLPPPSDKCSIFDGSLPTFTLTTVHRQKAGSPILDKAIQYRDYIEGLTSEEPRLETILNNDGEGIHVLPHADFVSKFVQKYVEYSPGTEVSVPLCTFTNESAINYNSMIRKAAYFLEDTIAPFYEGERLQANSIVKDGDRTILVNNESVLVLSFWENEVRGIPGYTVKVKGDYNRHTKTDVKSVFAPISKAAADKVLKALQKTAIYAKNKDSWIDYYALKNLIADLRPPFAGTTHKAQGGTFPAVFIDKTNINKCRDSATRARLMYVALTRASKNVYINA